MRTGVIIALIVVGALLLLAARASGQPLLGMGAALLLVAVFGELAVYGVEGLSARVGLSGYASSVVVNTIAVLPELFSALALGLRALGAGNQWLAEIALLSVLVSASFNFVVLGLVGLIARGVGVAEETLHLELPLMRVTVASVALLSAYAVIEAGLGSIHGSIRAPVALLVAQLVFWAYYVAMAVRSGLGGERREAPRGWLVLLVTGILGMIFSAEMLAGSIEEMIHSLHIEHIGEAALAVGVASSAPEAVLALLATRKGKAQEATGGLLAASSTSLLLIYPLVYMPLAKALPMDAFTTYTLAMLAAILWVTKRSLAHENMLDTGEALYILVLASTAMATLAAVK